MTVAKDIRVDREGLSDELIYEQRAEAMRE